jgi:hypothetical protein
MGLASKDSSGKPPVGVWFRPPSLTIASSISALSDPPNAEVAKCYMPMDRYELLCGFRSGATIREDDLPGACTAAMASQKLGAWGPCVSKAIEVWSDKLDSKKW